MGRLAHEDSKRRLPKIIVLLKLANSIETGQKPQEGAEGVFEGGMLHYTLQTE